MAKTILKIDGMSCGMCSGKVRDALKAIEGVGEVDVDLRKGTATIIHDGASDESLIGAVLDAGFRSKVKHGFF
ncbi:MAG: heavy-metal-associated domain-containing protein [Candidatus Methanoplasma sp.]|jgi:copper chaperone CopZ|nr:heavy-metal-associated domain-containing protein [Candidatus Methanoplasma sp.]